MLRIRRFKLILEKMKFSEYFQEILTSILFTTTPSNTYQPTKWIIDSNTLLNLTKEAKNQDESQKKKKVNNKIITNPLWHNWEKVWNL